MRKNKCIRERKEGKRESARTKNLLAADDDVHNLQQLCTTSQFFPSPKVSKPPTTIKPIPNPNPHPSPSPSPTFLNVTLSRKYPACKYKNGKNNGPIMRERREEPRTYLLPLAADDEVHGLQQLRLDHFLRLQGYQNPHDVCVGTSQSLRETPRVRYLISIG